MSEFRCPKCPNFYKGNWMCDNCYMDRHEAHISEDVWNNINKEEEKRKHESQEKKRFLGLIV